MVKPRLKQTPENVLCQNFGTDKCYYFKFDFEFVIKVKSQNLENLHTELTSSDAR